jgi:signal transduction histidine kinase/CheY-like chemotaxis protein/PAS domain-containing protein
VVAGEKRMSLRALLRVRRGRAGHFARLLRARMAARFADRGAPLQELIAERDALAERLASSPTGELTVAPDGRILEANERAAQLFALPRRVLVGGMLPLHVSNGDRPTLLRFLATLHRTGERGACQIAFALRHGSEGFIGHLEGYATRGRQGRSLCRLALSDCTAATREREAFAARLHSEQTRREIAEGARQRFDRITAAAAALSESLDLGAVVASAVRVGVPHVGWYCAIDLLDAEGHARRAAFFRDDGVDLDLPLDPYAPHGSTEVMRLGRAAHLAPPSTGDLVGLAASPAALPALRSAVGSYLCLPLRANGRTLGAVSIAGRSPQHCAPDDVPLAAEIARHVALAIDNARLYGEAREADQRKDELLALLGHELRNPLAAVVLAAARLRRGGADATQTAEIIERQGQRLVRLVDDLLDVSRITCGKITLVRRPVVIGDLVGRAVESVRPLMDERRHTLRVAMPSEPLRVEGDGTRLEQVLVNLLVNAAKYTAPGGHVALTVTRPEQDAVEIRVRDDGIGIPRERLGDIFAPFTQIDAPLDRTDRGLGIGLTLARRLVELHGGRITVHSEGRGQGTELVVRLPALGAEAPAPAPRPPVSAALTPPHATARLRVLVVEDHHDVAELLADELAADGHEVRVADDGVEAIDAALDFHPDLALIDIGLPGQSGYDVARRLRREPTLSSARLIALTGYGGAEIVRLCREAGFDQHFTKPISLEALQDLLRA